MVQNAVNLIKDRFAIEGFRRFSAFALRFRATFLGDHFEENRPGQSFKEVGFKTVGHTAIHTSYE